MMRPLLNLPDFSGASASGREVGAGSSGQCRILIAGSRTNKADGRQSLALGEKLSARGHRVVLLLPGPRTHECDDLVNNPGVVVWPSKRPTHVKDALFLVRLIGKLQPTHLVANFGSVNLMMTIGYGLRVPNRISWYHTLSTAMDNPHLVWKRRLQRFRKRFVYRAATDIVTNSAAMKRDVMDVFGVPSGKITVFPNSIADPLPGRQEHLTPVERDRIICVGRLHPVKGQDVLLHALSRIREKHPNAHVVFVGGGPLQEEYRSLAAHLGVSDRCRFLGGQPTGEVQRQLASAMISVVPSRSDAFPFVIIESIALGIPVVASHVGGIGEIIRDGVDGFLIPPDDIEALADRLSRLLDNTSLRAELGQNARQHFLQHYESEVVMTPQAKWIEEMVTTNLPA